MVQSILHNHNAWLSIVFAAYVAVLFVFAWIYFLMYRKLPGSFFFNSDVSRAQDESYRARLGMEADEYQSVVDKLMLAVTELENGTVEILKEKHLSGDGSTSAVVKVRSAGSSEVRFTRRSASSRHRQWPTVSVYFWMEVSVFDAKGLPLLPARTLKTGYNLPTDQEEAQSMLAHIIKDFQELSAARLELATTPFHLPTMWSYLDFLYFSTVTQSTVGYGDILPNCTAVRGVVILQILLGYALLIVIINLAIVR